MVSDQARLRLENVSTEVSNGAMNRLVLKEQVHLVMKLVGLWAALLVVPYTERTLLHARTYYGLFVGLALVFVVSSGELLFHFMAKSRRIRFTTQPN
jgi:hypothetical protein